MGGGVEWGEKKLGFSPVVAMERAMLIDPHKQRGKLEFQVKFHVCQTKLSIWNYNNKNRPYFQN